MHTTGHQEGQAEQWWTDRSTHDCQVRLGLLH